MSIKDMTPNGNRTWAVLSEHSGNDPSQFVTFLNRTTTAHASNHLSSGWSLSRTKLYAKKGLSLLNAPRSASAARGETDDTEPAINLASLLRRFDHVNAGDGGGAAGKDGVSDVDATAGNGEIHFRSAPTKSYIKLPGQTLPRSEVWTTPDGKGGLLLVNSQSQDGPAVFLRFTNDEFKSYVHDQTDSLLVKVGISGKRIQAPTEGYSRDTKKAKTEVGSMADTEDAVD